MRVVLVLDRCTDRSASVAAGWPSVEVVVTVHGLMGAARAAGVRYATAVAELDADATWISNTDSDSVVPLDWLQTQLRSASRGADLKLGVVASGPS